MNKRLVAGITLSMAVLTAACGASEASEAGQAATGPGETIMDMDMDMGDASRTAALGVEGAELSTGEFHRLDTAPFGYDDVEGDAWLARSDAGTTVTVELIGLLPNSAFMSHVHAGSCDEAGGAHYQFRAGGSDQPPNEIHLMFTSDANGVGYMTAENPQVAGPEALSVVVHPMSAMEAKVACADLG